MNERVEELLAEFIERREAGEDLSVPCFLRDHPQEATELRSALEDFAALEERFPTSSAASGETQAIGSYRVLRDLGRGGMGRVFEVRHEDRPDEPLALKQLHPMVAATPRSRERFRREGELLARLDHPNIVRICEVDTEGPLPHLVMDLVDGQSLAKLLAESRAPSQSGWLQLPGEGSELERLGRFLLRIARAVQVVHEQGLLHRDLKPANVIVRWDGEPVLIDFGLAVHEGSETITASGDLLGTPNYMSPEQARGERAEVASDIYGLGAILYELLTSRTPHPGQEPFEVLNHIAHHRIAPVAKLNPAVPTALCRITQRALSWKPERRYPSATAMADDLQRFLDREPVEAGTAGVIEGGENLLRYHPRLSLVLGSTLALAALLPWLLGRGSTDPKAEIDRLYRGAEVAWIEEDVSGLNALLDELAELEYPNAPRLQLLRWHAGGPPPTAAIDLGVDAMVEGLRAQQDAEPEAALLAFERAANSKPSWTLPGVLIARVARETGDDSLAQRELTAAVRLLPESSALAIELGQLHTENEEYAEAQRVLKRALTTDDENWRLWYRLAKAQALDRDSAGALPSIVKAMELAPAPDTRLSNLYASTVDRLGNHGDARVLFDELIAEFPDNSLLHFNRAYSLDLECQLAEARDAYRRSLELDEDQLRARIALAHIAAGSNREECETCAEAFRKQPGLLDADIAERLTIEAIERDRCETSWLPDFAIGMTERVDRREGIARALRASIDGAEVDERVVRIERALRAIEAR